MNAPRSPRVTAVLALLVAAWLAGLTIPPALLLRSRSAWLEQLDRPEAQQHWDEFRAAMRQQTGRSGPVQRKVPKSAEPPLRVWLRDYVWLAIAAWVVLGGVLGIFAALLVRGALLAQDQPARDGDDEKQNDRDAENTEKRKHDG